MIKKIDWSLGHQRVLSKNSMKKMQKVYKEYAKTGVYTLIDYDSFYKELNDDIELELILDKKIEKEINK